jgi:hypothetical protein
MKTSFWKFICISLIVAFGCKEKSHEHSHHEKDVVETNGNQALYNEVMNIHDEVMPKLEDIHNAKQELKGKITATPGMPVAEKLKIEAMILKLDSADKGMMVWMHEFNPLPDSLGEEKAREYLENEIERVKKVREDILRALEQAKN